jgi:E3 ubiquitin-protein ligase SHPRH
LSQQWIDELARHAPSLKVLVYPGWQGLSLEEKTKKKRTSKQKQGTQGNALTVDTKDAVISLLDKWPTYINTFDVCITTYDTLRRDLNVARAAPDRPARETAEYSRDRRMISPLVACEWYRVIMDEVRSLF